MGTAPSQLRRPAATAHFAIFVHLLTVEWKFGGALRISQAQSNHRPHQTPSSNFSLPRRSIRSRKTWWVKSMMMMVAQSPASICHARP